MCPYEAFFSENGVFRFSLKVKFLSGVAHPLHVAVADLFKRSISLDCQLIRDEACGGNQQIPFFVSEQKLGETEYCNVDLFVLKDSKIKITYTKAW